MPAKKKFSGFKLNLPPKITLNRALYFSAFSNCVSIVILGFILFTQSVQIHSLTTLVNYQHLQLTNSSSQSTPLTADKTDCQSTITAATNFNITNLLISKVSSENNESLTLVSLEVPAGWCLKTDTAYFNDTEDLDTTISFQPFDLPTNPPQVDQLNHPQFDLLIKTWPETGQIVATYTLATTTGTKPVNLYISTSPQLLPQLQDSFNTILLSFLIQSE